MGTIPDPLGITEHTAALARLGMRHLEQAERQAAKVLRGTSESQQPEPASPAADPSPTADPSPAGDPTLGEKLGILLARALEQSTASATRALYHRILDDMLPDEARILGALSDGSASALIHIRSRSIGGRPGKPLLENACLVGRTANVALPQLTPLYVRRLLACGVVEIGPEDAALKDDYQILLADPAVLRAVKGNSHGPIAPRVQRLTLRLSPLGRDLWAAT